MHFIVKLSQLIFLPYVPHLIAPVALMLKQQLLRLYAGSGGLGKINLHRSVVASTGCSSLRQGLRSEEHLADMSLKKILRAEFLSNLTLVFCKMTINDGIF